MFNLCNALTHEKLSYINKILYKNLSKILLLIAIVGQISSSLLFILGIYPIIAVKIMISLIPVTFFSS